MRKGPVAPLPDGRLLLVSGNSRSANFIALDKSSKNQTDVDLWVFTVMSPPIALGGATDLKRLVVAQTFAHFSIACVTRRVTKLSEDGFDEVGKWLIAGPGDAPAPIVRDSAQDFMARVMCDGVQPPSTSPVIGHVAALAVARRILDQPRV
jgi:hypothetical protein